MAFKLPTSDIINEMSTDEVFDLAEQLQNEMNNISKVKKLNEKQIKNVLWDSPIAALGNKKIKDHLDIQASARIIGAIVHNLSNKFIVEGL